MKGSKTIEQFLINDSLNVIAESERKLEEINAKERRDKKFFRIALLIVGVVVGVAALYIWF
jgi:hypothetical protein